jgi:hypothetical protein
VRGETRFGPSGVFGGHFIGEEAERWEEDELFGADEDSAIGYDLSAEARVDAAEIIRAALRAKACTHSALARAAKVSEHTLKAALADDPGCGQRRD